MRITAGRAALVRGDAATAARHRPGRLCRHGLRPRSDALGARPRRSCARLPGRPRRGEGHVGTPGARGASPRGAHKRSSVLSSSWARSSCSRGNRPNRLYEAVDARAARPAHWSSSAGRRRTSPSRSGYKATYPLRGPSSATRSPPAAPCVSTSSRTCSASFARDRAATRRTKASRRPSPRPRR